jgi:hypothetical protein
VSVGDEQATSHEREQEGVEGRTMCTLDHQADERVQVRQDGDDQDDRETAARKPLAEQPCRQQPRERQVNHRRGHAFRSTPERHGVSGRLDVLSRAVVRRSRGVHNR